MKNNAILFATTADAAGNPTAVQSFGGTTVVGRLLDQLAGLGTERVTVVVRPAGVWALREALGERDGVRVVTSADLHGDLLAASAAVEGSQVPHVIAAADVVVHREALAGLVADPRINSGVLASLTAPQADTAFHLRALRGRVVSAGSPFHLVTGPTGYLLDVFTLDPAHAPAFLTAARALAWVPAVRAWQEETAGLPAASSAVATLLVGLVRSGATLTNSYLRDYIWARPGGEAEVLAVRTRLDAVDEDEVLLAAAVKPADGFFTTFLVSPYSRYLARWAARRGVTPNQVTVASFLMAVFATVAFATGNRWGLVAGAVLFQFSFTLDCVDGQLARYTRRFSTFGAWLDTVLDRGKEYLAYAGLAVGAARAGDDVWLLAVAAMVLQILRQVMDFSYAATQQEIVAALPRLPLDVPEDRPPEPGATPALVTGAPGEVPCGQVDVGTAGVGTVAVGPAGVATRTVGAVSLGAVAVGTAVVGSPMTDHVGGGTATEVLPTPGVTRLVVTPGRCGRPKGAEIEQEVPEELGPVPPARSGRPRALAVLGHRSIRYWQSLDRRHGALWAKRIVIFPIGERFAVVSLGAAVLGARATMVVLLVIGTVAFGYGLLGRCLRSVAR